MLKSQTSGDSHWILIDRRSSAPLFRQIYERIRDAIISGVLKPGQRIPSARSLASQLATARGTIDTAYNLLANEGYILGRGAAGTVISPTLADLSPLQRNGPRVVDRTKVSGKPSAAKFIPLPGPFRGGIPALDAFPRHLWSRLAARRARSLSTATMLNPDPKGLKPLRDAIASYLIVARGVACSPEQIIITAGFQGALGLLTRVLLKPGDKAWMEDPGYLLCRHGLEAAGMTVVPVPIDEHGMDVSVGIAHAPRARLAVVTPTQHVTHGVALDLSRRLSLLAWAGEAKSWILEDDYDGEFHFHCKPLPALKSLDKIGRVLYVGTFSKVLFPGLRLGYLVLPDSLVEAFARTLQCLYWDGDIFSQAVVADFIAEGHFARHIKRMRQLYAERRIALVEALHEALADKLTIKLPTGGMHLLAHLKSRERDIAVARRVNAQGLGVAPLSPWCIKYYCGPALLLGFSNIPATSARSEVKRLEKAIS